MGKFVNSTTHPAYSAAIQNSTSKGVSAQIKWDLSNKWQLSYKFEQLLLDKRFSGDAYNRNYVNANFQFTANSSISLSFDKATATKPGINQDGSLYADTDSYYLIFRTWL